MLMKLLGRMEGADDLEEVKLLDKIIEKRKKLNEKQKKAYEDNIDDKNISDKYKKLVPVLEHNDAVGMINKRINELDKYRGWRNFP